jgi:hypothetical protein
MAPFDLNHLSGTFAYASIFLLLGMGFGAVLELSGFGDSRKLAAQFYLRDMTVLKVMFTGIVTAAVLIHLAAALGLMDLQRTWINPTYLASGIVGGLIMGVGFIIGGFCPGTSVVAASTLKIDGVFFVLGALVGVFAFGETVPHLDGLYHASFLGRFTLSDWLGLPTGVVLVLFVLMALAVFHFAEVSETVFGAGRPGRTVSWIPRRRSRALASGALVLLALVAMAKGEPTVEDRWGWIAASSGRQLEAREVYVDPAEVVDLRRDLTLSIRILEVREERDWNLFHLLGSRRIDPAAAVDPKLIKDLLAAPDNAITFLVSNGERAATEVWKRLRAQAVLNIYIVNGGINQWLDLYPPNSGVATRTATGSVIDSATSPATALATGSATALATGSATALATGSATAPAIISASDEMAWVFAESVGDRIPSAHPDLPRREPAPVGGITGTATAWFDGSNPPSHEFVKKVKLQRKVAVKGGCG